MTFHKTGSRKAFSYQLSYCRTLPQHHMSHNNPLHSCNISSGPRQSGQHNSNPDRAPSGAGHQTNTFLESSTINYVIFKLYIYIFIAIALDETGILVEVHFSMENISSHVIYTVPWGKQRQRQRTMFFVTDVCVTLVTHHHDVNPGSTASWLFQDLR